MAESKPRSGASKRSGTSASRNGAKKRPAAKKRAAASRSSSSASRSSSSTTRKRSTASANGSRSTAQSNGSGGITDTIKHAANKAKGPAVAVGAAAVGVAGGLVLKSRTRRKTVLGVPIPRHLPAVDPKAVAKSVGNASKQFAKTSKSVSKDIERAGDQAERIGKILS